MSRVLSDPTRFAVFRLIAGSDKPLTVRELVSHFELHHSAIRIHLARLERAELIGSLSLHREHAVGRPEMAFFAHPRRLCMTFPPRNFELLARLTLQALVRCDAKDLDTLTEIGAEWGREAMRCRNERTDPLPAATLEDALHTLQHELRFLGGNTVVSSLNGDGFLLTDSNCIFAPLSEVFNPSVCALHQGAIAGMAAQLTEVEFELDHRTSVASGAEVCTTVLMPLSSA